jgi:hypothetical protein
MSSNVHPFYSHSGKFGPHGPLLAVIAGVFIAYPLGIAYSYLIKWIPFVYLNCLITAGYGFGFGLMTYAVLKFGKVRNPPLALLTGFLVGLAALYGAWNGCAKSLIGDKMPSLLMPNQMWRFIKILNEHGSWGIGFSSTEPVTGILLAIFWIAEAGVIVGLSAYLPCKMIKAMPFCENHGFWLDKEKKIEKLDAFVLPDQIAAFKAGDVQPLEQSKARVPGAGRFARLTLKYHPECHDFCTLSVANVTMTTDKKGNPKEASQEIMTNLLVPKSMFEYVENLEHISARAGVVAT